MRVILKIKFKKDILEIEPLKNKHKVFIKALVPIFVFKAFILQYCCKIDVYIIIYSPFIPN